MKESEMKQQIKDRLIELYKNNGGLTPEAVVQDAKDKGSPLHECFEWDVNKAANEYWLDTARQLIRTVKVEVIHNNKIIKAPYFVRDPQMPANQQGYIATVDLRDKKSLAREAVVEECARAAAAFRRAQEVAAAVAVEQDVTELLNATVQLREKVVSETSEV
jgi:hypothetical protein